VKSIVVRQFGGPEVLQLEELVEPIPAPGQILVRVEAAGVNPVETYVRAGSYGSLPSLPYTPGKDAGGVIEAVGDRVDLFAPGDRVFTTGSLSGTYAEKALCLAEDVHRLPDRIDFAEGAAIGIPCGAAWRALFFRGKAAPGETVLVHGASGAVGLAAVQLAHAAGLTVIATAGSTDGMRVANDAGANHTVGHGAFSAIRKLTGGNGVDLIIEMLANKNLNDDLSILKPNGRVVVVGSRGPIEIDPRRTMPTELSILGMSLMNMSAAEAASMYNDLTADLESGVLRPTIGLRIPLADAARAHREVMEGDAPGKVVLVPAAVV
jgi:NADPH2:quinone reductase